MPDIPSLSSGRRSIKDPVVENLNVLVSSAPLKYHYIKDTLKTPGRVTRHDLEGEGVNLGFDVRSVGIKEGGMDLQLDKPTDTAPLAAHILKVTVGTLIEYFGITDSNFPRERNQVVRGAVTLMQIINPFFKGLLSSDLGDTLQLTYSIATMATTETLDPSPVHPRTGGTKTYAATQADGSALPTGVTINASTGVISSVKATVVAGTYTIKVTASDVLSTLPSDHPLRTLEGEATLILTITA